MIFYIESENYLKNQYNCIIEDLNEQEKRENKHQKKREYKKRRKKNK